MPRKCDFLTLRRGRITKGAVAAAVSVVAGPRVVSIDSWSGGQIARNDIDGGP